MFNNILKTIVTGAVLSVSLFFGALHQAAALDLISKDTVKAGRYDDISVIIETDGRDQQYKYYELTDAEKFLVHLSLERLNDHLRATYGQDDPIGNILTNGDDVERLGCGFDSTPSEPFQFGCWIGGKVCYVSYGEDGADFGCANCNGTNCPTS